ncbi:MAG TPA: HlyD family efflux transporter periplasmic adaptor subunit [Gemmatimonadaceae bacterium]|jgi:multidrug efflux pump subunit AcrA (membrane-fusion protein)
MNIQIGARIVLSFGLAASCIPACSQKGTGSAVSSDSTSADSTAKQASAATPVTMGRVMSRTLEVTVIAPGVLDVGEDVRVRAPFNGVLSAVTVNVGDVVAAGQRIGSIIAENSDAALRGAGAMVAGATTSAEKSAATRALQVARENLVTAPLRVEKSGVVIARPASTGERVLQGDSIVSVAATGRMIFLADVAQTDLMRVRPGQRARITLAARTGSVPATVHGVMPSDTGSLAAMRVRLDLVPRSTPPTVGMFGSATIVVAQRTNATVVPKAALVRDDITGVTKIALVDAQNVAHWTEVTPGVVDSAWAEILRPQLVVGQRVVTTGMAGLPDSTRVSEAQDTTMNSEPQTRPSASGSQRAGAPAVRASASTAERTPASAPTSARASAPTIAPTIAPARSPSTGAPSGKPVPGTVHPAGPAPAARPS